TITIERRRAAEEVDLRFAELLEIGRDALEVAIESPGDDEPMRNAGRVELDLVERGDLERMIDQLVVVGRAIASEAPLVDRDRTHRRRDAPLGATGIRRRLEVELDGLALSILRNQKQRRAVEERAPRIEERAAHRRIERVDLRRHDELALRASAPPRALVRLLDDDRSPAALRANADDVTRELPQQVASG